MNQEILKIGQIPFLFAIKELEKQEKYELCAYAKKEIELYCEYYRITMRTIEGYEVQDKQYMRHLIDIAMGQISDNFDKSK